MFPCTTVPPAILPIPPLIGHTFGSIYCSLQFQSVSFRCAKHYVLVTLNRIIRLIFGPTQLCACKMAACFGPFFGPPAGKRMKLENFAHLLNFVEASWDVMANAQKPDFVFRRNARPHLNRQGASFQSTTGSRGVRTSGSNAGYNMFRGSVKSTGYPLHSPVSPSLPLPCVAVCHHISAGVYNDTEGIDFEQRTVNTNKQTNRQTNNTCAFMDWNSNYTTFNRQTKRPFHIWDCGLLKFWF